MARISLSYESRQPDEFTTDLTKHTTTFTHKPHCYCKTPSSFTMLFQDVPIEGPLLRIYSDDIPDILMVTLCDSNNNRTTRINFLSDYAIYINIHNWHLVSIKIQTRA